MIHELTKCILRPMEPYDEELLFRYKNDQELADLLGGFHLGYSHSDIAEWIEKHRKHDDEELLAIADKETNACLGHVGLYNIDYRVRSAEFAILIGEKKAWGAGLGKEVTSHVIQWGFKYLNLNRIYLSALANNERALRMYLSIGFKEEGRLRQAQFKNGRYLDEINMSILRSEYFNAGQE